MENMQKVKRLILERWPRLRERAQNEKNPERLIAIFEEIDDFLFNLEMRIAAQDRNMHSAAHLAAKSNCQFDQKWSANE